MVADQGVSILKAELLPPELAARGFTVGDGDLMCNAGTLWQALTFDFEKSGHKSGGVPITPIFLSDQDIQDGRQLRGPMETRFLLVKKGSSTGRLTLSVTYYAWIVSLTFPSFDPSKILVSQTANNDYWLSITPVPREQSESLIEMQNTARQRVGLRCLTSKPRLFFVDAVAAFGDFFSPETPRYGMASFVAEGPIPGVKALNWIAKNPGAISSGFMEDNWDFWGNYYKSRIVPDHPISEPMRHFLQRRDPALLRWESH